MQESKQEFDEKKDCKTKDVVSRKLIVEEPWKITENSEELVISALLNVEE